LAYAYIPAGMDGGAAVEVELFGALVRGEVWHASRCSIRAVSGSGILASVSAFVTAGAGFLLSVLWFDLMFDVQVGPHHEPDLPDDVLASVAGYYGRVTTSARPMNRLIAAAMLGTLVAIVVEIVERDGPGWVPWVSLALAAAPILLAGARTVPSAVRLGRRGDAIDIQSALARSIFREHLICFASIAALLVLQLSAA
jgi:hypothetical protein